MPFFSFSQKADSLLVLLKERKQPDSIKLDLLCEISKNYWFSAPEKAIEFGIKAQKLADSLLQQKTYPQKYLLKEKARAINNTGVAYYVYANYSKAIEIFFQALDIHESIDNQEGMGHAYNNIGLIYFNQKRHQNALEYYYKSLGARTRIKVKDDIGASYTNIGEVHEDMENLDSALQNYLKSESIFLEKQNLHGLGVAWNNLGSTYYKLGYYWQSLQYLEKALVMHEKSQNDFHKIQALNYIAKIQIALQNWKKAEENALKSLEMAKKMKTKTEIKDAAQTLSIIYEHKRKHEKALLFYKLYTRYKDSIFNEDKELEINRLSLRRTELEKENLAKDNALKQAEVIASAAVMQQQKIAILATSLIGSLLMGLALILYRQWYNKQKINDLLVFRQRQLSLTNDSLEAKQHELEIAYSKLEDTSAALRKSVEYASDMQAIILPTDEQLQSFFADYFVIYKPRDVVSGDFYWFSQITENMSIFALADCTGHGVPGAFMSMLGNTLLNEIINVQNIYEPARILRKLNRGIRNILKQDEKKNSDGMDISVCYLEKRFSKNSINFIYAGAKSFMYVFDTQKLISINGDKVFVGGTNKKDTAFTNHTFQFPINSIFYLVTDGFIDQNNIIRQRFGRRNFENLISSITHLSLDLQQYTLLTTLKAHQDIENQRDDISVMVLQI